MAAVVGGQNNLASAGFSSIIGGSENRTSGSYAFIAGSVHSSASTFYASVMGSSYSLASAVHSSILGGKQNIASGVVSAIVGGSGHTISGTHSAIIGGRDINGSANDTVYVPNLVVTSEKQIFIATGGTNPSAGLATLIGGTATINTNKVTAASLIMLTEQDNSNPGDVSISARVPGVSFTITSSNGSDTSDVAWIIFEPSLI